MTARVEVRPVHPLSFDVWLVGDDEELRLRNFFHSPMHMPSMAEQTTALAGRAEEFAAKVTLILNQATS